MHGPTPTHPASHPMLRQESYNNGSSIHGPVYPTSPQDEAEELDTLSRPRLTQDQIAILEKHFKGKNKPNTDFKRQLAKQIGLSLQRVNVGSHRFPHLASTDKSRRTGIKIAAPKPDTKADPSRALMLYLQSILPNGHCLTYHSLIFLGLQCMGFLAHSLRNRHRVISYQIPAPMSSMRSSHRKALVLTQSNPQWILPTILVDAQAWRAISAFPQNQGQST